MYQQNQIPSWHSRSWMKSINAYLFHWVLKSPGPITNHAQIIIPNYSIHPILHLSNLSCIFWKWRYTDQQIFGKTWGPTKERELAFFPLPFLGNFSSSNSKGCASLWTCHQIMSLSFLIATISQSLDHSPLTGLKIF